MCTVDERGLEVKKKEDIDEKFNFEFVDFVFFWLIFVAVMGFCLLE